MHKKNVVLCAASDAGVLQEAEDAIRVTEAGIQA